ncbi:MAG TPA: cellulase family glycosylhydrolase [Ktedonobacterales bacterium]
MRRQVLQAALALVVLATILLGMLSTLRSALSVRVTATPAPTSTLAPTPTPDRSLAVSGTQITQGGQPITLLGAARFSLEFACHGDGHFQLSDFLAMRSWGMNTVRLPLSSAFWRNLDGKCPDYQATVTQAVANAEAVGLYVILDLQRDAPFNQPPDTTSGGGQCPLPDTTYDVRFWQNLARIYQNDPRVLFDLYGEPRNIDGNQWLHGGPITSDCYAYRTPATYTAIGIPALATAVRAIAPHNLIILSGLGWGYDLSAITPVNLTGILYATHPWNHGNYEEPWDWPRAFGTVAQHLPVIATEFGAYDCQTGYIATEIAYFEQLHMSFLAWAWTTGSCGDLIADWNGTPTTPYGQYIRGKMLQAAPSNGAARA